MENGDFPTWIHLDFLQPVGAVESAILDRFGNMACEDFFRIPGRSEDSR